MVEKKVHNRVNFLIVSLKNLSTVIALCKISKFESRHIGVIKP